MLLNVTHWIFLFQFSQRTHFSLECVAPLGTFYQLCAIFCKSTSMHSSIIKEQSYHQWPCLALINKLWWHIYILYILFLWLISLSAALDAEEEDRGGAMCVRGVVLGIALHWLEILGERACLCKLALPLRHDRRRISTGWNVEARNKTCLWCYRTFNGTINTLQCKLIKLSCPISIKKNNSRNKLFFSSNSSHCYFKLNKTCLPITKKR